MAIITCAALPHRSKLGNQLNVRELVCSSVAKVSRLNWVPNNGCPRTAREKKGYIDLIRDTKQAFLPRGKIVTVALGHQQNLGREAYELLDRVHIMSYDHPGQHSTLEHAKGDAARYIGFGVPKGKLLLGVPFYARSVEKPNDSRSYGDLAEAHDLEPGSDWTGDYYFNGIDTMKKKAAHAQELGLGGIMVWEMGQDARGGKSLLRALYEARR